jgi:hypothetical protein
MARKKQTVCAENKEMLPYAPNEQEQAALQFHEDRKKGRCPAPQIKLSEGRIKVDHQSPDHGWELLLESMGTSSDSFAEVLLAQLACATSDNPGAKGVSPKFTNFGLAVVSSVRPRDELEAMLAAQMAAIHCSSMNFAVRLNSADTLKQRESAERSLNRLARTFTCQLEALKKYRGGEQRIIVQHQQVNVNEGGQAIVGTVEQHHGGA